jgi:hypothetical protein
MGQALLRVVPHGVEFDRDRFHGQEHGGIGRHRVRDVDSGTESARQRLRVEDRGLGGAGEICGEEHIVECDTEARP